MKRRLMPLLLALCLLTGCGRSVPAQEGEVRVVATTYPVYLFACAVTDGVEGVRVERLNTGSVSCLHDYTLSMTDMKKIELADVIAINGAELESFMEDALAAGRAEVIDCSGGVELLENLSHLHVEEEETDGHDHRHHEEETDHGHEQEEDAHDHEQYHPEEETEHAARDDHGHDHGHWDPHYWMAPENACIMVDNLYHGLARVLPGQEALLRGNAEEAVRRLEDCDREIRGNVLQMRTEGRETPELITFHDGFQYFAHTYGMPLLESIEEEAGSEASAKEIVEITALVKEHGLPVIFTEVNGSDATAKAITRETGCGVAALTMIMDGPDMVKGSCDPVAYYSSEIRNNISAIFNGFAGKEEVNAP